MLRLSAVLLANLLLFTGPALAQDEPRAYHNARAAADADSPVVRATGGNIGMYFQFGGLAALLHSNTPRNIGNVLIFERVGLKFAFSEKLMLPVWFGTGLRVNSPNRADSSGTWGIDLGAGLEYHFRIWRRISPFIGGAFGINVADPSGSTNAHVGIGLGPVMGIEYYIGDRLSLTAQYMFVIGIEYQDAPDAVTSFSFQTRAGGALNITYYF